MKYWFIRVQYLLLYFSEPCFHLKICKRNSYIYTCVWIMCHNFLYLDYMNWSYISVTVKMTSLKKILIYFLYCPVFLYIETVLSLTGWCIGRRCNWCIVVRCYTFVPGYRDTRRCHDQTYTEKYNYSNQKESGKLNTDKFLTRLIHFFRRSFKHFALMSIIP